MPTLMSRNTFYELLELRKRAEAGEWGSSKPAGLFVPWAGEDLIKQGGRGLYYVGIATDGCYGAKGAQTYESCFARTKELCNGARHDRSGTPFWRFLNGLSTGLFGVPFNESVSRWGWSNLLKIGVTEGCPGEQIIELQRDICVRSLREEFGAIRDSLIFVATAKQYDLIESVVGNVSWDTSRQAAGIYFSTDSASGNLIVRGYHPGYAQRARFLEDQSQATLALARDLLEWASIR